MSTLDSPLQELRVAVTGGTSGLGLALVRALHAQGARVAFVARDARRVRRVAAELAGTHGIVGDIANKTDTHRIALQINAALGGLDVLVNNASSLGPVPLALLADTGCEDLDTALAANLVGPFRLTKALLGSLTASARERRRGAALVINISSDAAVTPYVGWGAYSASKAALLHLSRIWNEELAEHGVHVVSFDPGDMDTPLHALAVPDADPASLRRPVDAARELVAKIVAEVCRMKVAHHPVQRPRDAKLLVVSACGLLQSAPRSELAQFFEARDAKLLVVSACGLLQSAPRSELAQFFERGDLLVGNDAATLPASLVGIHLRSGAPVEVRLAGRRSLALDDVREFSAIVFGAGDYRTRTEDRAAPPRLRAGDTLALGPLRARVLSLLGHQRLIALAFDGTPDAIWAGLASHGKPVQYAHVSEPLALWDVWTRVAALPVAFEPPSAGFVIDWQLLHALKERGVEFATLTHAAGLSSTGDAELDARLPFDEPYHLPQVTVDAIAATRQRGGRVIALGTTVTRALEHAASQGPVRAGDGLADQKIGAESTLRIVDAIVSGTHEPATSHYELLRAFASDAVLARADAALLANGYRTHEFGDSVLIRRGATHQVSGKLLEVMQLPI